MTFEERAEILDRHVDALATGVGEGAFTFTDPATGRWVQIAVAREGAQGELFVNLGTQPIAAQASDEIEALLGCGGEEKEEKEETLVGAVQVSKAAAAIERIFCEGLCCAPDFRLDVHPPLSDLKRASNPLTTMLLVFFGVVGIVLLWTLLG